MKILNLNPHGIRKFQLKAVFTRFNPNLNNVGILCLGLPVLVSRTKWSLPPICSGVAALLAALEMLYIFVTPLPCSLVLCSLYIEAIEKDG